MKCAMCGNDRAVIKLDDGNMLCTKCADGIMGKPWYVAVWRFIRDVVLRGWI